MANTIDVTQAQHFVPEIWANEVIARLRSQIVATPRVLRDTDVAAFSRGDILHIPYPGTLAASPKAAGTEYTLAQPSGETEVQVALNHHEAVSVVIEDIVRAQANQDIVRRYSEAAAIALAEKIESDLVAEMQTATNYAGAYGTDLGATAMRAAWKKMTDVKGPQDGRFALVSTQDAVSLLADTELTNYFAFSRPQAVAAGPENLGNLYGFETHSSQFIALAGADVAVLTGANATDILTSATHGLSNGDVIEITALTGGAGLSLNTQYYVISSTANTFQLSATAGGAAVDFTSDITAGTWHLLNRKSLAWRRDGAIVAFRGLPEPPAGSGAVAANVADPESGVVVRSLMAYDARLGGVQITHEVLYGVKKLDEAKLLVLRS